MVRVTETNLGEDRFEKIAPLLARFTRMMKKVSEVTGEDFYLEFTRRLRTAKTAIDCHTIMSTIQDRMFEIEDEDEDVDFEYVDIDLEEVMDDTSEEDDSSSSGDMSDDDNDDEEDTHCCCCGGPVTPSDEEEEEDSPPETPHNDDVIDIEFNGEEVTIVKRATQELKDTLTAHVSYYLI